MRPVLAVALSLLVAALAPRPAMAQMIEVEASAFVPAGKVSFTTRGPCEARPGPDGQSLWVACPDAPDELETQAREALVESRAGATVRRFRGGIELVVPTYFGGYRVTRSGRTVTVEVGRRTASDEASRLGELLRFPIVDATSTGELAELDALFARNDLEKAAAALGAMPRTVDPAAVRLRKGDLAWLQGDPALAAKSYRTARSLYRADPCALLASMRLAEIAALELAPAAGPAAPPSLDALDPAAPRVVSLAWLEAARLALWRSDLVESFELSREVAERSGDEELRRLAASLGGVAFAGLLQRSTAAGRELEAADLALAHEKVLVDHPGAELLAPLAYRALMRARLYGKAASVLQAQLDRTDSDRLVGEWAVDVSRAFLKAGQAFKAAQVIEYALALPGGEREDRAVFHSVQARAALAQKQPGVALDAISKVPVPGVPLTLRVARAATGAGELARAEELLRRLDGREMAEDERLVRDQLRAEIAVLTADAGAGPLLEAVSTQPLRPEVAARLRYLYGALLERRGELPAALEQYRRVPDAPQWGALAKIAAADLAMRIEMAAQPATGGAR